MSSTEIAALIVELRNGRISLDQVAAEFRRRVWAPTRSPAPSSSADQAGQWDPGGDVPGSYDEVTAAYDRGDLTSEEYQVLSDAVADSINAEARGEAGSED
jgi:hypothetical protein